MKYLLLVVTLLSVNRAFADKIKINKTPSALAILPNNPQWIEKSEMCKVQNPTKMVYFFMQRHLDATADTKHDDKPQAQAENQYAIYDQLKKWIDDKKISTVLAEGCTGEITKDFSKKFNGWTMQDLLEKKKEIKGKNDHGFDKILTHIPMKLKAYFGDKIRVLCADDEKEIQAQLLEMSDMRGDIGFLRRIQGLKDKPEQQKSFVDGAIGALKLPQDSSAVDVTTALKKDINEKIKDVESRLSNRNHVAVEVIKKEPADQMAIVFGGLHAKEIKELLEKENIGCEILVANGYKDE